MSKTVFADQEKHVQQYLAWQDYYWNLTIVVTLYFVSFICLISAAANGFQNDMADAVVSAVVAFVASMVSDAIRTRWLKPSHSNLQKLRGE